MLKQEIVDILKAIKSENVRVFTNPKQVTA